MTYYYWDFDTDNVFLEEDENGNVVAEYTHEPGLYGELIAQERDGQVRYYNFDGQGSTRELTDENGDVTDTYTYTAFGEEIDHTGTTENPFRYKGAHGYYTNSDTNDIYVRERVYEPKNGRWRSTDPLLFFDAINLYVYAWNCPSMIVDPSGTACADLGLWTKEACKQCPPCTCEEVHTEKPPSPRFPLGELGHEVAKDMNLGDLPCTIRFKIGDCGFPNPNAGRTCAKGTQRHKREIFVCIQEGTTRCILEELLRHELIHAKQLCNQKSGSDKLEGKCEDNEDEAYRASCKERLAQKCLFDRDDGYKEAFDECVARGKFFSCKAAPGTVTKTCKDILNDVFGVT